MIHKPTALCFKVNTSCHELYYSVLDWFIGMKIISYQISFLIMLRFNEEFCNSINIFYCFQQKCPEFKLIFPSPIITIRLSKKKKKNYIKTLTKVWRPSYQLQVSSKINLRHNVSPIAMLYCHKIHDLINSLCGWEWEK